MSAESVPVLQCHSALSVDGAQTLKHLVTMFVEGAQVLDHHSAMVVEDAQVVWCVMCDVMCDV